MIYVQNLSHYKTAYQNQEWKIEESSHYIFHFEKNSLAEQDIESIILLKESHYSKIVQWLGENSDKKINYYIYPSLKKKILLMGDDSPGNVVWEEINSNNNAKKFEIHAVYNEKCKFVGEHEDTHLLSLPWGLSIYLFCEGLAQYMENSFMNEDLHASVKKLLQENKLYSIEFLCDNNNWESVEPVIIYPQVGSFTKHLIEKYNKEKFKELYRNTSRNCDTSKNLSEIEKVYQKSIYRLETEWLEYISK
ncbi:MAG: hypothetical protein WCX74_03015 [Candidatus Paceibacterota bacterium]